MSEAPKAKKSFYDEFFSGKWNGDEVKEYGKEAVGGTTEELTTPVPVVRPKKQRLRLKHGKSGAISRAEEKYVKQQLEIQDRVKEKREMQCANKKLQKQRKTKSRAIMKRTKKGQPVMHLQVNQLLHKIEKQNSAPDKQ